MMIERLQNGRRPVGDPGGNGILGLRSGFQRQLSARGDQKERAADVRRRDVDSKVCSSGDRDGWHTLAQECNENKTSWWDVDRELYTAGIRSRMFIPVMTLVVYHDAS